MKLSIYDLVTLSDDKRYIIVSIINHNDINYYLLCDENNPKQYMFCYLKEKRLVIVKDNSLYQILSLKITKDLLK